MNDRMKEEERKTEVKELGKNKRLKKERQEKEKLVQILSTHELIFGEVVPDYHYVIQCFNLSCFHNADIFNYPVFVDCRMPN